MTNQLRGIASPAAGNALGRRPRRRANGAKEVRASTAGTSYWWTVPPALAMGASR